MKRIVLLFCLIVILCSSPLSKLLAQKIQFKDSNTRQLISSIELFDGVIYLNGLVNDEYKAHFVLDTGTDSISAVSIDLASKMGVLSPAQQDSAGIRGKKGYVKKLYGTRLSIEGVQFTGYDFIALPLGKLEPYWGRKIDGLLGGNILKNFVITIDYEKCKIIMVDDPSGKTVYAGYRLPMTVMGTTPMIEANIIRNGETEPIPGRFIVDTGVRFSFINTPFIRAHNLLSQSQLTIENITGYGIGGLIFEKVGRVAYITLGGAKLKSPTIQLSASEKGLRTSTLFDGIIGADLLSRFTVVFDYPGKVMYFQPNKTFHDPFLYDMSGIYFTMESLDRSKVVRVVNVVEGSPAASSGVNKGDVILEIDGRPAADYSMPQLKEYFKREGMKVNLKLERDGKVFNVTLVLKSII